MEGFLYLITHFFTHKDFLLPADQIPGTLFTPLHWCFEIALLTVLIAGCIHVSRNRRLIRPVFTALLAIAVVWEFVIIGWESLSGKRIALDLASNLPLYPCSIYMYVMPFVIWGHGTLQKMARGFICTLGLVGALINFVYPVLRLSSYSCISFAGFHTFFYHGAMLFTALVLLLTGDYRYSRISSWKDLLLPCVPTLILSVPANLINYSPIHSDYMFFRGRLPIIAGFFPGADELTITLAVYTFYILLPAVIILPPILVRHLLTGKYGVREESLL